MFLDKWFKKSDIEKQDKMDSLLNIIDSIKYIDDNTIGIKLSKNIMVYNEGSTVYINKGYQVLIGKEIHLNPTKKKQEIFDNILQISEEN